MTTICCAMKNFNNYKVQLSCLLLCNVLVHIKHVHVHTKTESRGFCKRTYSSSVTVNFLWGGNRPPVRKEDLVSDPFSLPQMRKLIGYILILSWDCHFLCCWPVHQMVDSYRNQGEEEQTWTLESGRLGLAWGLGLCALLHSACQPVRKDWKSHQHAGALLKHGWPPHKVSKQMALHDGIGVLCAARGGGERNINGTFLLKEKLWMM